MAITGNIIEQVADNQLIISGGTASNLGANIVMYGQSHATTPDQFRFRKGSTVLCGTDASNNWSFNTVGIYLNNTGSTSSGKFHVQNDSGWYGMGMTGAAEDSWILYDYGNSDLAAQYTGNGGWQFRYNNSIMVDIGQDEMTLGRSIANYTIQRDNNDYNLILSGGTDWNVGASIVLYGGDHLTAPNHVQFRTDGTTQASMEENGDFVFLNNVAVGQDGTRRLYVYHPTTDIVANFESGDASCYITLSDSDSTSDAEVGIAAIGDELRLRSGGANHFEMDTAGLITTKGSIVCSDSNSSKTISGGSATNLGANIFMYGQSHASYPLWMVFRENSTAWMTYNATTNTINLNQGKLNFPATQSASSDANTLDDYEEGNWTPVFSGSGGTSGQSYSQQVGSYVKIGQLVWCTCYIVLTNKGTITDQLQISGLPFTALASGTGSYPAVTFGIVGYWTLTSGHILTGYVTAGSTYIRLQETDFTGVSSTFLTTSAIANNTQVLATFCYRASA